MSDCQKSTRVILPTNISIIRVISNMTSYNIYGLVDYSSSC